VVLTGKVPEAGVGLVFEDAWEMLHGTEGGWTFDLRDNPWLRGTPPGGRYQIDHVLPALSPESSVLKNSLQIGRASCRERVSCIV
jgi:hypothetical protein